MERFRATMCISLKLCKKKIKTIRPRAHLSFQLFCSLSIKRTHSMHFLSHSLYRFSLSVCGAFEFIIQLQKQSWIKYTFFSKILKFRRILNLYPLFCLLTFVLFCMLKHFFLHRIPPSHSLTELSIVLSILIAHSPSCMLLLFAYQNPPGRMTKKNEEYMKLKHHKLDQGEGFCFEFELMHL